MSRCPHHYQRKINPELSKNANFEFIFSSGYESEEENKGLSEEEIKQKLQEEFAATMAENERMLKEMEQKWEEKLEEAAKENREKVGNNIICFICCAYPELVNLSILKDCFHRVQISCEARLIIRVDIFK